MNAASRAALVWFRRDLRDFDHAALAAASAVHSPIYGAFVFDTEILDALPSRADARVTFIWESVRELCEALAQRGVALHACHGRAREEIPRLARELGVVAVFANRDYEPQAIVRDEAVARHLGRDGIAFHASKDQVLYEADEIRTAAGTAYSVFTPYKRAWLSRINAQSTAPHAVRLPARLRAKPPPLPTLEAMGFVRREPVVKPGMSGARRAWAEFRARLRNYAAERDFPAMAGTSGLSAHLRFGTLSIRELVRGARASRSTAAATWLSELAWREFFFAVLVARPDVVDHAYRREFDKLEWEEDESAWRAWREGRTGYPLVDAGMRELAAQGTLHNRVRMVTASFLVKDLGIDWRRGERHFASLLLDYDLAANNGNWQWCASTGCDAQPWFRIFNPVTQSKRFDPDGTYIRRWAPELARVDVGNIHAPWEMSAAEQARAGCVIGIDYPARIVSHEKARGATLERYGALHS